MATAIVIAKGDWRHVGSTGSRREKVVRRRLEARLTSKRRDAGKQDHCENFSHLHTSQQVLKRRRTTALCQDIWEMATMGT